VGLPDAVAAEALAHELLQQQLAHGLQSGVGQQHLQPAAAILHLDPHARHDGGVRQARDRSEARVHFQPVEAEADLAERLERGLQVLQYDADQPFDQGAFDRGVGASLDAHRGGAAPAAQQHVDDGIDQRGIDDDQAVIVPLLGPEHRQHGRQRDGVQVVAEALRGHCVDRDLDIVRGEVTQRGGHQPHQPVEHDLQHRQPLIGDEAGGDDALDPRQRAVLAAAGIEAEQAVDLGLVQDAGGIGRRHGRSRRIAFALDRSAPGGGEVVFLAGHQRRPPRPRRMVTAPGSRRTARR
jgi:hypothetical protein